MVTLRSISNCSFIIWYWLVVLCTSCDSIHAYKAHSNYNPYKYDTGNVMFTPDGRLLRVEYAIKATEYSAPIYLVRLTNDVIVMACAVNRNNEATVMDRLIVLPQHSDKNNDPSSTIVVSVAGVLADGLALLQKLQDDLLREFQYFGGTHQTSALHVAETLARYCQQNSLFGGIRPYGAMVWTMGFDDNDELEIFQTSPSGAIQRLSLRDDGGPLVLGDRSDTNLLKKLETSTPSETISRIAKLLSTDKTEPELLLVSSTRGALKLTRDQVQSYLQR